MHSASHHWAKACIRCALMSTAMTSHRKTSHQHQIRVSLWFPSTSHYRYSETSFSSKEAESFPYNSQCRHLSLLILLLPEYVPTSHSLDPRSQPPSHSWLLGTLSIISDILISSSQSTVTVLYIQKQKPQLMRLGKVCKHSSCNSGMKWAAH